MSRRTPFHPVTRIAIVVLLVAVLATLLTPLVGVMGRKRDPLRTVLPVLARSLDQYAAENGRMPGLHARGTRVPPALFRSETLGAFAVLSVWSDGDLSALAFWPKSRGYVPPATQPRADGGGWLEQPAALALDWSTPRDGDPDRPILAERDPDRREGVFVSTVFGSVRFLPAVPGTAETPPVREGDPPLPWSVPYEGDDLFTRTGDGLGMDVVGGGSATRCFLK